MTAVRLIGYWAERDSGWNWPDPHDFVDPTWDFAERELVADHLVRGTSVNQYRGLSPCRFCGRHNGSAEITDGQYCWPEGLAHYITDHDVRLPKQFVAHVHSALHHGTDAKPPKFDDMGQRDRYWPDPSPWGDSTPWNDEWWTGVVHRYLEQGGSLPRATRMASMVASVPLLVKRHVVGRRPGRRARRFGPGYPDGISKPTDGPFCCLKGLASYLHASPGRRGPEFSAYFRAVLEPLHTPHEHVDADPSWWSHQRRAHA